MSSISVFTLKFIAVLDENSSANSFINEVEEAEASVEFTHVSEVASTVETTTTANLVGSTVVNNDDGTISKPREKKADLDAADHSSRHTRIDDNCPRTNERCSRFRDAVLFLEDQSAHETQGSGKGRDRSVEIIGRSAPLISQRLRRA